MWGLKLSCVSVSYTHLDVYKRQVKVRVMYDPQDLGEIQVWAPDAEEPITVEALSQAYARGLTEQQNEYIQKQLREQGDAAVNEERLILSLIHI